MYDVFRPNTIDNDDPHISLPGYVVGVDLGKSNDYTAISILSRKGGEIFYPIANGDYAYLHPYANLDNPIITKPFYQLVHLERARGVPYPDIVKGIKEILNSFGNLPESRPPLIVDATGVGQAVVDMIKNEGLKPISVTITGGDSVTGKYPDFRVPKRDLVGALVVLFQTHRLTIARDLPEFQNFLTELQNFKVKISDKGHDSYEAWREGQHDDMVLSVAIAAWYAEKCWKDQCPTPEDPVEEGNGDIGMIWGGAHN